MSLLGECGVFNVAAREHACSAPPNGLAFYIIGRGASRRMPALVPGSLVFTASEYSHVFCGPGALVLKNVCSQHTCCANTMCIVMGVNGLGSPEVPPNGVRSQQPETRRLLRNMPQSHQRRSRPSHWHPLSGTLTNGALRHLGTLQHLVSLTHTLYELT